MRKYIRFIDGFRRFHKIRMEPGEAIALARTSLKKRVAAREENFLNFIEKGIFQYPASPYRHLLEPKKITLDDLCEWVGKGGLEAALRTLEAEGVYFTVDEFKGRVPVRRDGVMFQCNEKMFDNPFLAESYEVRSGATRSAGTRVRIDFDYLHQRSLYDALLLDVHGCLTAPVANWFPVFPGAPGINSSLRYAHIGNPVRKWFSQVDEDKLKLSWERNWGKKMIYLLSRIYGNPLAPAVYVDLNHAGIVAKWAARMLEENPCCVVYTFAASAARVCMAASDLNLNLKGARFLVTGEPLTPQKKKEIEAMGAHAVPVYGISEAGVIAAGCNQTYDASDHCHLYEDTTAIIPHQCRVPYSDSTVDSYLFTNILYESPKMLLNVDMGDYGDVETGPCACGFGELGFRTHLSNIRSYEKLTGEGVTFVNTDFVWIIESKLPEAFGGKSTDYQLVEGESHQGIPHLRLLVSPRVGTVNESELVRTFLGHLRHAEDRLWAQSGTEMWTQSGMIQVIREIPVPTASGKILPFYSLKPSQRTQKTPGGVYGISSNKNEETAAERDVQAARS
ncbi:MAG TPA: hypothetical protein VFZ27_13575 [Terriglobia bacterium]|nr:hypothetical protein [Terriglobia bacterium]